MKAGTQNKEDRYNKVYSLVKKLPLKYKELLLEEIKKDLLKSFFLRKLNSEKKKILTDDTIINKELAIKYLEIETKKLLGEPFDDSELNIEKDDPEFFKEQQFLANL